MEFGLFSEFIFDPTIYIFAVPALLIFGISKGGFGGNLGILALPIMVLGVPVEQAVAIMLPVLCAMDLVGIKVYRGIYDKTNLNLLIPPAIVGIGIGWFLFEILEPAYFTLGIACFALGFLIHQFFLSIQKKAKKIFFQHSRWKANFFGCLLGLTSTIAHAGGVPGQIYLLPQNLSKEIYVGTTVYIYVFVNYTKLIPYYFLGQLNTNNLAMSVLLFPLAPVGIYLGRYLQDKIDQKVFYRFCYLMLFFTSVKLVYDSLIELS